MKRMSNNPNQLGLFDYGMHGGIYPSGTLERNIPICSNLENSPFKYDESATLDWVKITRTALKKWPDQNILEVFSNLKRLGLQFTKNPKNLNEKELRDYIANVRTSIRFEAKKRGLTEIVREISQKNSSDFGYYL